jgi:hypothetical protein
LTRSHECAAVAELTDQELARLAELRNPCYEAEGELYCQLEQDHAGAHAALGQASSVGQADMIEEHEWWLRWTAGGVREIVRLAPCPADAGEGDDPEVCELPSRHTGAHSFDLEGTAGGRRHSASFREHLDELVAQIED